jgi:hypothetical protein
MDGVEREIGERRKNQRFQHTETEAEDRDRCREGEGGGSGWVILPAPPIAGDASADSLAHGRQDRG